ncbi:MAG TPA: hypothetical protein EYP55_09070, partial [Anaerolineae bacterium]|nr:hypothetical protein [Anaerolineae bacterium]
SGRIDIKIRCGGQVSEVTLNILDLDIHHCDMIIDGRPRPCTFQCDPSREVLNVALPRPCVDSFVLRIAYEGEINDKMAGFYRSSCTREGRTVYIAVTQFQESDARRAFPCFDNPRQKATFAIEIVIDEDLTAVSNMDVVGTIPAGAGKKRVKFRRTPRMSTYLVFLASAISRRLSTTMISGYEWSRYPAEQRMGPPVWSTGAAPGQWPPPPPRRRP